MRRIDRLVLAAGAAAWGPFAQLPVQGTRATARERGLAGPLLDEPAYDGMPAEAVARMFAGAATSLPVGRTSVPGDIAQRVEMLVTSTFATGMLLDIDGGARMPL